MKMIADESQQTRVYMRITPTFICITIISTSVRGSNNAYLDFLLEENYLDFRLYHNYCLTFVRFVQSYDSYLDSKTTVVENL